MTDFSDLTFEDNADQRGPVMIVLDCSDSMTAIQDGMAQSPLQELNAALDVLIAEIDRDKLSRRRADISFLPYGTEPAAPTPFATVDSRQIIVPELYGMGLTYTAKALNAAIDHLEARKQEYRNNGVPYNRPLLFLLSDGLTMDDLTSVSQRIKDLEAQKKLSFFPVGVTDADMDQLSSIGTRNALKVSDGKLAELFQWLSASVASVSASAPGDDKVKLPAPTDWAEF